MITKNNYITRRRSLIEACQQDLIIITGTDLVQKSSDETYDFEQDGYFYYLTGINEPGWILIIDKIKGDEFLVSTDESSYHNEIWEVKHSHQDIAELCGIDDIRSRRDGWGFLRREISNYQSIGTIVPKEAFSKSFGMYINPAKTNLVRRIRRLHKDLNMVDISDHIRRLRSVKDEDEINEIRKAIDTTNEGLQLVHSKLGEYQNEAQIYADFAYTFMNKDSSFGYKPVIASGKNSTKLHYKLNNGPINQNDFLLIDVGATSERYTADITRTYSIGRVSKRHQQILDTVAGVQQVCIDFIKPGVTMIESQIYADNIMGDELMKLGIIDNKLRKSVREFFPHGIGHHLGVDVHDSGMYDEPLQPGAVITVEPGIYLPEEGIGVRIEDDVLLTASGVEILSKKIEK